MKPCRIYLILALVITSHALFAQKGSSLTSKWANSIKIDGNLADWGDSLNYYFPEQDLHYSIANNEKSIFFAIRVKNKPRQNQALLNGFSIIINGEGKKKEGPRLIFPIPDRSAMSGIRNRIEDSTYSDFREMALDAVRAIYIQNFPKIKDGAISLTNNYGIHTVAFIDENDYLCYESSIAIDQLALKSTSSPLAINIKINGIVTNTFTSHPMGYPYGGRYQYYDYSRPRTTVNRREEAGTWQMVSLATEPNTP